MMATEGASRKVKAKKVRIPPRGHDYHDPAKRQKFLELIEGVGTRNGKPVSYMVAARLVGITKSTARWWVANRARLEASRAAMKLTDAPLPATAKGIFEEQLRESHKQWRACVAAGRAAEAQRWAIQAGIARDKLAQIEETEPTKPPDDGPLGGLTDEDLVALQEYLSKLKAKEAKS